LSQMKRYLEDRLRVAREHGGEGLIAELVRVEMEGGRISANEMVSMIFLLLGAGSETTTHLISGSVYELIENPTLRDWLEEDWSRAGLAVEEFLRFVSPVQFSKPRFVRRDIELDGVRLKRGDRIMAMVAAPNMDPQANEHPEQLDLSDGRTGTSLSAPASISVLAISLHASKACARFKRCSRVGQDSGWQWRPPKSAGASALASGRSKSCPSWKALDDGSRRSEVIDRTARKVNTPAIRTSVPQWGSCGHTDRPDDSACGRQ